MFPHCIKKDWNKFKTVRSCQWSSLDVQVEGEGKQSGHPHGSPALFSLYSSQRVKGYALSPMGLGIHTSLWFKPDSVHNQGGLPVGVGLEVVSSKCTQVPLALLDRHQAAVQPTYPHLSHFQFASRLPSDHPTPHVAFSLSPLGRPRLRCPLVKWSGLGSQLHVFVWPPAAGQIFYITSLGFLPQQDRGQRCASMGLARPNPPAFLYPGWAPALEELLATCQYCGCRQEVGEF